MTLHLEIHWGQENPFDVCVGLQNCIEKFENNNWIQEKGY